MTFAILQTGCIKFFWIIFSHTIKWEIVKRLVQQTFPFLLLLVPSSYWSVYHLICVRIRAALMRWNSLCLCSVLFVLFRWNLLDIVFIELPFVLLSSHEYVEKKNETKKNTVPVRMFRGFIHKLELSLLPSSCSRLKWIFRFVEYNFTHQFRIFYRDSIDTSSDDILRFQIQSISFQLKS